MQTHRHSRDSSDKVSCQCCALHPLSACNSMKIIKISRFHHHVIVLGYVCTCFRLHIRTIFCLYWNTSKLCVSLLRHVDGIYSPSLARFVLNLLLFALYWQKYLCLHNPLHFTTGVWRHISVCAGERTHSRPVCLYVPVWWAEWIQQSGGVWSVVTCVCEKRRCQHHGPLSWPGVLTQRFLSALAGPTQTSWQGFSVDAITSSPQPPTPACRQLL